MKLLAIALLVSTTACTQEMITDSTGGACEGCEAVGLNIPGYLAGK
jgi:hypothetical protein